jgi:dTDP-4-dehydrorhamnose reductase
LVRVAITGASGQLGRQLVSVFGTSGFDTLPLTRAELRLEDSDTYAVLRSWSPNVIINAAAWTHVDGCALDPAKADELNGRAPGRIAVLAADIGALMVQISTNEVFDGAEERAYLEGDAPSPINPYGTSKLLGERLVQAAGGSNLIIRTAWVFGPGSPNFVSRILEAAGTAISAGQPLRVVGDEWGNPTPAAWLADAIRATVEAVLRDGVNVGLWHLAGAPPVTRAGWAAAIVKSLPVRLEEVPAASFSRPSRAPRHAVLGSERPGPVPDSWERATAELVAALGIGGPSHERDAMIR